MVSSIQKKVGLVILVIGFLIIMINAVDYLGGYTILPSSSSIFGLVFTGIGAALCYKKKE